MITVIAASLIPRRKDTPFPAQAASVYQSHRSCAGGERRWVV